MQFEVKTVGDQETIFDNSRTDPQARLAYHRSFRYDAEVFQQIVRFVRDACDPAGPEWPDILRTLFPGDEADKMITHCLGLALLGEFDGSHHPN